VLEYHRNTYYHDSHKSRLSENGKTRYRRMEKRAGMTLRVTTWYSRTAWSEVEGKELHLLNSVATIQQILSLCAVSRPRLTEKLS